MAFMGNLSLVSLAGRPHIIINIEVNSIVICILSVIMFTTFSTFSRLKRFEF